MESLSLEQRHQEYLRQLRLMKTRSFHMVGDKGILIAGYEVIRVLGEGSFGVVKFIREKEQWTQENREISRAYSYDWM